MATNDSKLSRVKKNTKTKKVKKPVWKKILLWAFIAFAAVGLSVGGLFISYIITAPELDAELLDVPFASQLYDKDGQLFADMGSENRIKIKYEDLPEVLIEALTATEDSRFFDHPGIDVRRIFGAVIGNFKNGFGSEGASTITQQVVENMFLTPDKKIKLKVQEQWLALKLERAYSKEEILEMYLNKIYFGSGAYGVGKAAEVYFGIDDLHELTLVQAAILAGLPQRPNGYNPFEYPELMQGRVNTVLKLMVRHGKITQAEADEAAKIGVETVLTDKVPTRSIPYQAFVDQIEKEIEEKIPGTDINSDGLIIHTTLDVNAQKYAEFLLAESEQNPIHFSDEKLEAAITVVDTKTGAIRAIGGSHNNQGKMGYNYATQVTNQGGSVMKPILAYAPAIEFDNYSTYEQILDDKFVTDSGHEIKNVDKQQHGWVSVRTALTHSYNIPALKTFEEIGSDQIKPFAEKLGIKFPDTTKKLHPQDAIGGTDSEITVLNLAGAYSPLGNEGIYNEPFSVTKVEFPDGSVINLQAKPVAAMSDFTAYMVTDMMKSVMTSGTGKLANIPGLPIAGKTGTTNESKNIWFGGFTTNYTIATWTGYANPASIPADDRVIPRQLFKHMMTELSKDIETPDFVKPDSVVEVAIEKGSNPPVLASENTPKDNIVKELFVKGTEPTKVSDKYKELKVPENLTAIYNEDENAIDVNWEYSEMEEDYEFEVSYKVNDGELRNLATTPDLSLKLTEVDIASTYTIQVVTIDKKGNRKSDPATVTVNTPETMEPDDNTELETIPEVTNLVAKYMKANSVIEVTWEYNGPTNVTFEVNVNGQTKSVNGKSLSVKGAKPGETYEVVVTVIDTENKDNRSKAKTTNLKIPTDEVPPDETVDPEPGNEEEPPVSVDPEEPEENEIN